MTTNLKAFLDTIAHSEGTTTIPSSDDGYNVLVGSTLENPLFFDSYATHPHILDRALDSTAAGRYQIIYPTFASLCLQHGYSDFKPSTQDLMATDLINECNAMEDIVMGRFEIAVQKCSKIWASFPGGTSGQHENPMFELDQVYRGLGGQYAQVSA